ncbi:AMP-binding protein [Streptomyces sp. NPDC089919]|uniref:AMP-binding protein n=1 Tax=Streptomyces sp. NPDC089919 TaxID=3155188 RepID=UPI00344521C8
MTQASESGGPGPRTTDTVIRLFERRVRDTPAAPAVVVGDTRLTYRELDRRAEGLARRLTARGLPPGGIVAVAGSRPEQVLAGLLAALKAGGAFAVLDPESPRTAVRALAAIRPWVLLAEDRHRARFEDGGPAHVLALDEDPADLADGPPRDGRAAAPGETAAVLLSGAEGIRPVPVGQARLAAALEGWTEVCRLAPGDRHLITGRPDGLSFAAGWTRALCTGGTLVLPAGGPAGGADGAALARLIAAEDVTVLHTDPGTAGRLPDPPARPGPDPLATLRLVTVTGARYYLDEQAALQRRLRPGVRLLGVYGTAECAGAGTHFEIAQLAGPAEHPEGVALLGTPFPGWSAQTPKGELWLTPPDGDAPVATGDRATLRADGLLEFGGRGRDRIRAGKRTVDGYRVESEIRSHPGVGAAVLAVVDDGAFRSTLVAYLTPAVGAVGARGLPTATELRGHLAGRVAEEDLPKAVVRLRALPRNRAGQEDRTALPQPAGAAGVRGVKTAGAAGDAEGAAGCAAGCVSILLGAVALMFTSLLWPGATELGGVPGPWNFLFFLLYCCECLAFGAGVVFLFTGRERMLRSGRSRGLTAAAHLAVVWLLAAWWPQDNFYRLADKHDWPRQAALVYTFNIPLMIAAGVVAVWATRRPAEAFAD